MAVRRMKNMVGETFGRLLIVAYAGYDERAKNFTMALCLVAGALASSGLTVRGAARQETNTAI